MKLNIFVVIFTLANLCIMINLVAQPKQKDAQTNAPVIRARSIELVDGKGQSRALLSVEANGETVFRLRDAEGTIRVKLGASTEGSALLLLNASTNPGIHALAKSNGTSVTLIDKNGQKKTIKP
ncbi:MAG: hypothetical protein M3342_10810 [Bacteroidota bacterium]|nr:hypothetical protein [Bacteroidota bacterium]